jgi:hypothetical protein
MAHLVDVGIRLFHSPGDGAPEIFIDLAIDRLKTKYKIKSLGAERANVHRTSTDVTLSLDKISSLIRFKHEIYFRI